ncbi:hypothetical protein H6P81_008901 [Aristolochia fimbriata]|uniref:C2H2-type domain-containing protein n=1 Tax=Aristolochia fimbriata TaxID=158543 RepID=A0AAV7EML7_ARIFI|nr:hypothetical protein H6P81_008901 [Aristolochia fimbriata]
MADTSNCSAFWTCWHWAVQCVIFVLVPVHQSAGSIFVFDCEPHAVFPFCVIVLLGICLFHWGLLYVAERENAACLHQSRPHHTHKVSQNVPTAQCLAPDPPSKMLAGWTEKCNSYEATTVVSEAYLSFKPLPLSQSVIRRAACRREEGSPLDLNNLPDDYGERYREGKQVLEESSTASAEASDSNRIRKKKSGGKEGKDECEKVYECRFCSLKFCKSQALGGHMNRHRQERETETLNRARQLVFSNESLAAQGPLSHLGYGSRKPRIPRLFFLTLIYL